ncbi:MAG: cytochrome c biogenesis protein CcsA [Anaerolineae bacterium]|jgi:cytochrome c-type biogenesis protein CcmF|nr:cytochrome c biogenesis protein CcsA [Anaerolineae bacterium]
MLAEIGLISVLMALITAFYAMGAAAYSWRVHSDRWLLSARNAALITCPLLLIANLVLLLALMTQDYQISYVWSVTNPSTPMFYRMTALWGSQAGSLLFWSFTMSLFTFGAIVINWRSDRRLMPGVILYMMAVLGFFLVLNLFFANPFTRFWITPEYVPGTPIPDYLLIPAGATAPPYGVLANSAQGLNPLLRHFGMIIHPPMLYLGFVGFVIPFAFAMAALASGDLSTNWIKATRRWALVSWLFLSLGLILGGRWAYDVLGWGGYWGWDPVENAAFLPWLLGTAFIHSVMIQEKRGMLKVWNMFLVIGTFSAVMFGTFATRSGLIDSVHSFARSNIGLPMFLFWASLTLLSIGLIVWRWGRGELRDEQHPTGLLSRETLFVLNNVVFVALTVAIFWGSFGAPILSEVFTGTEISLGAAYFMQVTPPLFLILFILMGIAPLSAWGAMTVQRLGRALIIPGGLTLAFLAYVFLLADTRNPVALLGYGVVALSGFVALYEIYRGMIARSRTKRESLLQALIALFTRNRRRYGGYLVHLGITVIGIGIIGSTVYQAQTESVVNMGGSIPLMDYQMRFDGITEAIAEDGRDMVIADVTVIRDGQAIAQLRPRIDHFGQGAEGMSMTIAGAYSTAENDFYVLLTGFDPIDNTGRFWVYINPLVNLIWWGSFILIAGTMICAWTTEPATVRARNAAALDQSVRAAA